MDKFDIIIKKQQLLFKQQLNLMATVQELSDKVDLLQVALDEEQAQVLALVAQKDATIVELTSINGELKAQLEGAATPEAIQAVADKVDAVITDLKGTIAD